MPITDSEPHLLYLSIFCVSLPVYMCVPIISLSFPPFLFHLCLFSLFFLGDCPCFLSLFFLPISFTSLLFFLHSFRLFLSSPQSFPHIFCFLSHYFQFLDCLFVLRFFSQRLLTWKTDAASWERFISSPGEL